MNYNEVKLSKTYFRAYDIRGVIDDVFNENAFYTIGRAISCRLHQLGRKEIFIGRDARLSSAALAKALAQGLMNSGIKVISLGEISSPIMYYATNTQGIDCGLMVTGSHNPSNYNGLKMVLASKTLVQADIDLLYTLVQAGNFTNAPGEYSENPCTPSYMQRIVSDIKLDRCLKVVVDAGNGVAGPIIVETLTQLGCEVIPLYCEVDGSFPNHHPDPSIAANLVDLQALVLGQHADLGLAFDGDADRLGVVTNQGKIIWPDRLMMLYVQSILKKLPGATIVYDVKCTSELARYITENGGNAHMCATGHSIVKGEMKQLNAALAGELSGHLFFNDRWYGFDDALYSACRLLEILSQTRVSLDEQFTNFPESVNTPEMPIPINDDKKFIFMEQLCQNADFPDATIIRIDGLRVEYSYGWGLVRASNTTPCLVTRFEAYDTKNLNNLMATFKAQLLNVDSSLKIPF